MSDDATRELFQRVTSVLLDAEEHERAGQRLDAIRAWHRVALLEDEIARLFPAAHPHGAGARVGAISAAIKALDPALAVARATAYLDDAALPSRVAERIEQLRAEASEQLRGLIGDDPEVAPMDVELAA